MNNIKRKKARSNANLTFILAFLPILLTWVVKIVLKKSYDPFGDGEIFLILTFICVELIFRMLSNRNAGTISKLTSIGLFTCNLICYTLINITDIQISTFFQILIIMSIFLINLFTSGIDKDDI